MDNTQKLTIRLSPETMARLKENTRRTHLSRSAYIRMTIMGHRPKAYPPQAYFEATELLHSIGGTLTAIADTAQVQGIVNAAEYRNEVSHLYREILSLQRATTAPEEVEG